MSLSFSKTCPTWVRRRAKQWARRLRLDEWSIALDVVDDEDLQDRDGVATRAMVSALPAYLSADIWLSDDLANDANAEAVIVHELRHLHYEWITQVFNQAWDGRRRLSRADALTLLNDKIEELIERDTKMLLALSGRKIK